MQRNNKPARIIKGTAKQPTLKDASGVWTLDEAMQAHRANSWPQPNLFQPVANSLRFDASKKTFLSRAIARSGNQRTWTWSGWFKPSLAGGNQYFFISTDTNGNPFTYVYFSSGSFIWWDNDGGGTFGPVIVTNAIYRDTSAWYHIVLAVDTTQSTASNRAKLYINGIRVTSFSTEDYPNQGEATYTNSNAPGENVVYIGAQPQYLTGYLTEVNFVDGYQLDPSLLGKFDTNNTWVPVAYTGSYGTNGFYLPFTNATTSQTLGYDASLNGTPTYDADQDPYRGSVSLHLTGNGPAGGQNNTFVDSSANNFTITRAGATTQGSFSPFPMQANTPYNPAIHGASAYFRGSGNGDYLSIESNAAWAFSTGDFTIEAWIYLTSLASTYQAVAVSEITGGIWFGYLSTGLGLRRYNVADVIQSSTAPPINTWIHLAVTRSGSTTRLFINGALNTSVTNSDSYNQGKLIIGSDGTPGSSSQQWPGYISNLRITKGAAIYTAAFTPTNRPFGTLTNNLLTFSEDFTTYTTLNVTMTGGAGIAPDGTPSATKINATTSGNKVIYPAGLSAGTYTASVYAKAGELEGLAFATGTTGIFVNLRTGTIRTSYSASPTSSSVTAVGNGWYRCAFTFTLSAGNSLYIGPNDNVDLSLGSGITGTGSNGIFVWGAQLESGSTLTNYTPTPANFSTAPSVLLNFANAAVVDSVGGNNIITGSNATVTSNSKYGSGALTFNGSTDFVSVDTGASYTFGTTNFTAEYWVYFNSVASTQAVAAAYNSGGSNSSSPIGWTIRSAGVLGWEGYAGTIDFIGNSLTPTASVVTNTWYHVATVRNNGEIIAFLNGRIVGRVSVGNSVMATPAGGVHIGRAGQFNGQYFNGSVDDFRITRGVARYTTDFTPPARALPEIGGDSFVTVNVNAGVVQRFTATGTTTWTAPIDVTSIELLVVAGGGGAGHGGGGAGGVIYNSAYPVIPGSTYTVTVGAGGIGGIAGSRGAVPAGTNGGNSLFGSLVAIGGGAGGRAGAPNDSTAGGSGGGGSGDVPSATIAAGTAGQGFPGGVSSRPGYGAGGGGGGAGGPGSNALDQASDIGSGGNGGTGLSFGISGAPTFYAGGGGGGANTNSTPSIQGGLGGTGGGGAGARVADAGGTSGTTNTGGGGGGAEYEGSIAGGGAGGSGVVIIRYTTTAVGNTSDETTDNLVDSPTLYGHDTGAGGEVVGNYCTLNPIDTETEHSFSNGNLTLFKAASNWSSVRSTMAVSSGKWYFETTYNASWDYAHVGVLDATVDTYAAQVANSGYVGKYARGWAYQQDQRVWNNDTNIGGSLGAVRAYAGDITMVALDMDAGKIWFGVNGVWFNSGNPAAGTNAAYSNLSGTVSPAFSVYGNSSGITVNFGQRAWKYTPPAGFNAITTKNLPRPAVGSAAAAPDQYFGAVTYTGTGSARSVSGFNFAPDLLWVKDRSSSSFHRLFDRVRGVTNSPSIYSNATGPEAADNVTFTSNGFSYTTDPYGTGVNVNGNLHVVWGWKAGGTAVSNTSGTITSQVSANTTSGFSIVTWTGVGSSQSVGHGLGATPKLIIFKSRNQTGDWYVYTTAIDGTNRYLRLNATSNALTAGPAVPTASVFYSDTFSSANNMIAYCWAEIEGFSKIGTYTGNGLTDGPFVYTGFRPAFVMVKCTSSDGFRWIIWDTARDPVNFATRGLSPNIADAEITGFDADILSNGFKLRDLEGTLNASGATYLFMAFAEKSFGNVNGTAR